MLCKCQTNVKLQFSCNIYATINTTYYIVVDEITKFISHDMCHDLGFVKKPPFNVVQVTNNYL
jgi:hypothetical protein